jgi:hypothetical protein
MNYSLFPRACALIAGGLFSLTSVSHAALLAYEPFTNAPGTAIIGSGDGLGFADVWQSNGSAGTATNTSSGLTYTDAAGHTLVTTGGAGFFQGLTTANSSMQPNRPFDFTRAIDGGAATTWISLLIVRQGPTNGAMANPYPRGVNVTFDYPTSSGGVNQRLGVGNSSGAATNTIGIISGGGNLRPSASPPCQFGGGYGSVAPLTNLVVLRVDHIAGAAQAANDNVYLWVNPTNLAVEPALASATTNVLGLYDYSLGLVRVFVGGQDTSNNRPYGEALVDEIRVGETYADVVPFVGAPAPQSLMFTNIQMSSGNLILSGTGGTSGGIYRLLANEDVSTSSTNWPAVTTNQFDSRGNFVCTYPVVPGGDYLFLRLKDGDDPPPPPVPPTIVSGPTNLTVSAGETAGFSVLATGTAPLNYRWFFETNTLLDGLTSSNLTLTSAQWTNAGGYSVRVSNIAGAVTSSVAILTILAPPFIAAQPQGQTVILGNAALFSVEATGTAPLNYQWFFQTNTPLPLATNASYAIVNVQSNAAGGYSVVVTNSFGSVTSLVATLVVESPVIGPVYYVATNGNDNNPGTSMAAPFKTIGKGLAAVGNGGLVYVRGGVYALSSKLSLNKTASPANAIRLWAYPGETPVIDFNGDSSDGFSVSGDGYHLKGLTVVHAGHNGINISGASNIVEFCTTSSNANTGLHITGDLNTSYNLILNCDSYRNYDAPTHGQNADGFSAKWIFGPGNVFSGCRAWENADDGWDLWMGTNTVIITNCWAFRNGTNIFGDNAWQGNGNGFKLGGQYVGTPHRLVRSVAFENMANGVDQNNNLAGQTLDNNTCWANRGRNFAMAHGVNITPHVVRNNLSFAAGGSDQFTAGTLSTNNSWQIISSPPANSGDVQSVDSSKATAPRNADGSLPYSPFLRPVPGGRLVDQGVDTGDPYLGSAPDIGAFEDGP